MTRAFPSNIVLILTGCMTLPGPLPSSAADAPRGDPARPHVQEMRVGRDARASKDRSHAISAGNQNLVRPPAATLPALGASVRRVSQIATGYGDQFFLVVDKIHGKIALFENGEPIFAAEALTGNNTADYLPADAMSKTYAQQVGIKYKVTPAGRFTVSTAYDPKYGDILEINELQAKDWVIAVHRVALVNSQQRDLRLRSSNDEDKHITDGCVDVDPSTIRQLVRLLGGKSRVPIYILPMDERLITRFFPSRETASNKPALTG